MIKPESGNQWPPPAMPRDTSEQVELTHEAVLSPTAVLVAEATGQLQRGRPFQPGQSGNPTGRPKGSKNKLTEVFLSAMAEDFAEHGPEAIARVRTDDPAIYLKIIGSLLPRKLVLERELGPDVDYAELSVEEVGEMVQTEQRSRHVQTVLEWAKRG